jgi:hypothetical protein
MWIVCLQGNRTLLNGSLIRNGISVVDAVNLPTGHSKMVRKRSGGVMSGITFSDHELDPFPALPQMSNILPYSECIVHIYVYPVRCAHVNPPLQ